MLKRRRPGQNLGEHHRGVGRHLKAITQFNLLSRVCEIGFDPHQQSATNTKPIPAAVEKDAVVNIKCC